MKKQFTCYADFHLENKGYSFEDKSTGEIKTKYQLYWNNIGNQKFLNDLTNDTDERYKKVDSKGWKDGELINCISDNCYNKSVCIRYIYPNLVKKEMLKMDCFDMNKSNCNLFIAKPLN